MLHHALLYAFRHGIVRKKRARKDINYSLSFVYHNTKQLLCQGKIEKNLQKNRLFDLFRAFLCILSYNCVIFLGFFTLRCLFFYNLAVFCRELFLGGFEGYYIYRHTCVRTHASVPLDLVVRGIGRF